MRMWFKAKRYGYGWYPATWEGWVVTLGYCALVLLPSAALSFVGPDHLAGTRFLVAFILYIVLLTAALLWVCVQHGEPARWRWGGE